MIHEILSDTSLAHISSTKIFERGVIYASSGAVRVLGEDSPPRPAIRAEVDGTKTYTTSVWVQADGIVGSCDCPHADDRGFCKHQVAVALVWRRRLTGTEPLIDDALRKKAQARAKRAQTDADQRDALHGFLRSVPAASLADKLIDLADGYREIERELQQWRKIAEAHDRPEQLKSLLTDILNVRQPFLPLSETRSYVHQAEPVLALLQQARERDAASAALLALHALRRCWAVLMKADDSNGVIGDLTRAIGAEWVAALQCAGEQPADFGEVYLRVRLDDPFGCFDEKAVEAVIGDRALERYRALLETAWRKSQESASAERATKASRTTRWSRADDHVTHSHSLERLHLEQLECVGDVDGAICVLRTDLSGPHRFAEVTQLFERHNRLREAFANAERACKAFPDSDRLQQDLLRCYERDGWVDEAYSLRRKQFAASPSLERYHQTLSAGVAAARDGGALREELLQVLEEAEIESQQRTARTPFKVRSSASKTPVRDVSLRAHVLCSEGHWTHALDLVQPPAVCDARVLRHIALHLDPARWEQSVTLLIRVFEHAMRTASTPYREELDMVREIADRLEAPHRTAWLCELRIKFKAKRNFVRDLPT